MNLTALFVLIYAGGQRVEVAVPTKGPRHRSATRGGWLASGAAALREKLDRDRMLSGLVIVEPSGNVLVYQPSEVIELLELGS